MSARPTRERAQRRAIQLALGLSAAIAFGMAAYTARAEDSAANLLANPQRLEEVQRGCKTNQPWATDALCRQAAEAIRRRFKGHGVPYTPKPVDSFPTHPEMKVPPPAPATQSPPNIKPKTRHRPKPSAASKIA